MLFFGGKRLGATQGCRRPLYRSISDLNFISPPLLYFTPHTKGWNDLTEDVAHFQGALWVCHTCELVMSYMWMIHATHLKESFHTYERVVSHIWMSHVTHMIKSCHVYERVCHTYGSVMSHIWMSHVTHVNDLTENVAHFQGALGGCHTCESVMSHMWTSHATHMNESCHTYEWVMSHM